MEFEIYDKSLNEELNMIVDSGTGEMYFQSKETNFGCIIGISPDFKNFIIGGGYWEYETKPIDFDRYDIRVVEVNNNAMNQRCRHCKKLEELEEQEIIIQQRKKLENLSSSYMIEELERIEYLRKSELSKGTCVCDSDSNISK
jgi:hypothetical protein